MREPVLDGVIADQIATFLDAISWPKRLHSRTSSTSTPLLKAVTCTTVCVLALPITLAGAPGGSGGDGAASMFDWSVYRRWQGIIMLACCRCESLGDVTSLRAVAKGRGLKLACQR